MGIRDWMGKNEKAAVLGLVIILLLIVGATAYMTLGGSRYRSIDITYEQTATGLKITERFDAAVANDNYQVLYRSFQQQVCLEQRCDIQITDIQCREGTPYIADSVKELRDAKGDFLTVPASVHNKIEQNEAGCFKEEGYRSSEEVITITYEVSEQTLATTGTRHRIFSEKHFPIMRLTTKGTAGEDSKRLIGASQKINADTRTGDISSPGIDILSLLVILTLLAVAPYIAWKIFGTEKRFTVPEYLHVVPNNKREQWQVDVLTNGTSSLSKNGLAAITLSLQVKGVLRLEKGSWGRIKAHIKKDHKSTLTKKEQAFIDLLLLDKDSEDDTEIHCDVRPDKHRASWIMFKKKTEGFYESIVNKTGHNIQVAAMVIGWGLIYFMRDTMPLSLIAFVVVLAAALTIIPSSVFSRFKQDNYREYLEWLSFKAMLTDMAQIQKYLAEDHDQWKEWLIYGAALGAADEVLKALEKTNVLELSRIQDLRTSYAISSAFAVSASRSGGAGGGGGGGFGGGGGGGR